MKELPTKDLVKIGTLAKMTGTSVSTLKFYVKEGLLEPRCKTGKNMSWYDPACADTIRTIRALQKERFYPLSVIRQLLKAGPAEREIALLDAIHKVDYRSDNTLIGLGEAVRQSRLSPQQIGQLSEAGLIDTEVGKTAHTFTQADLGVMLLVRRRLDAGIPFDQTLESFRVYAGALRRAVSADINGFIAGAILTPGFTAEMGTQLIRVSDETLDAFVDLKRKEYNRIYGSGSLEDLYRFETLLTRGIAAVLPLLQNAGLHQDAALCAAVLTGERTGIPALDRACAMFRSIDGEAGSGIGPRIARCAAARDYFSTVDPLCAGTAALAVWCTQLCWLRLAPEILNCGAAADHAWDALTAYLKDRLPNLAEGLLLGLSGILEQSRGAYQYL